MSKINCGGNDGNDVSKLKEHPTNVITVNIMVIFTVRDKYKFIELIYDSMHPECLSG